MDIEDFTDQEIEQAKKLFAGSCDFMRGIQTLEQLPPQDLPEIAFAGRSNVGKSSLINALTGRKALARTSHTPGRTQQLNFFNLGEQFTLVDMPGYGYAKVSKKDRNAWTRMIKDYLRGRISLKRTFVLVDSRHGLKDSDVEMMKLLDESAAPYTLVFTKTDKPKREELAVNMEATLEAIKKHPAAYPEIIKTSANNGYGIDVLKSYIYSKAITL